jgi:nucleoside-diphosphate-sugar epimerase
MPPASRHLLIGYEHPFAVALAHALQTEHGEDQVQGKKDPEEAAAVIATWRPTHVYGLTAMVPVPRDAEPAVHWHRCTRDLLQLLEAAKRSGIRLFYPSGIAVFGVSAPIVRCPNGAPQDPPSIAGLSQRAGERWCEQFHLEHQVDVRSLRLPVLIRSATAGKVFRARSLLSSPLTQARPVLHLQDAVRATIELMAAPPSAIRERRSYNLAGISLSLMDLSVELGRYQPEVGFEIWNLPEDPGPASLDDTAARSDWGWRPRYDLLRLVRSLLEK